MKQQPTFNRAYLDARKSVVVRQMKHGFRARIRKLDIVADGRTRELATVRAAMEAAIKIIAH